MDPLLSRLQSALADRYRIERELGSGGMATVHLAHDVKHDRDVAIKVLRPHIAAALGAERLLAEVRITARLDHPHILTLIDSGNVDGALFYVMPFVRGESLRAKLTRESQLGVDEALTITRQNASALDHARRQGVVHRGIKPENILLHEGEAFLTDFGVALAVREAGGDRALQAEMASAIASVINLRLTRGEQSRLSAAPSIDPAAHEAYLKGRFFFNRPNDENLQKAIAQFDTVVKLSPKFAPAYSGLSDAYIYKAWFEYDWEGSERELRRAIALNPNYAYAHDQLNQMLGLVGRFDEAIAEGERAMALDPLSPSIITDLVMTLVYAGKGSEPWSCCVKQRSSTRRSFST